jgi:hypothetical protein
MLFSLEPESPKQEAPAPSSPKDADQFVDQFMYALTAPYIGWPGWGDDPAFWEPHKTRVTMERLLHHQEIHRDKVASEYETMLYLSSATLSAPPTHDWYCIYAWLFRRWHPEQGAEIFNDHEGEKLNVNQQEDLARLRAWIFRIQMNYMEAKMKGARKQEVEMERQELEASQPELF